MYNLARSVHQLLEDNSVAKIEVCAVPPFIKLIFDKSELQALIRGKAEISNVIAKYFLRRRVFWIDIRKEHYEGGAHSRFPGHALTPTGVMAIRCKQFHLPDL